MCSEMLRRHPWNRAFMLGHKNTTGMVESQQDSQSPSGNFKCPWTPGRGTWSEFVTKSHRGFKPWLLYALGDDGRREHLSGRDKDNIPTTELPGNALWNKASESSINYSFIHYESPLHEARIRITLHMQRWPSMQQAELSERRSLPTNWFLTGKIEINELEVIAG